MMFIPVSHATSEGTDGPVRSRNFARALPARTLNKGSGQQVLKPYWIVVLVCKNGFAKMHCLVLIRR